MKKDITEKARLITAFADVITSFQKPIQIGLNQVIIMGYPFSATLDHAVGTMAFLGKFQKPGTKITCAYWILENNPMIPGKMKFVPDPDTPAHYLLVVTEGMHISELVAKLKWIEQRMAVMNDLKLEAYKNA